MDQSLQIVLAVGGIVSTVCSTVVIVARMKGYVTVTEYRTKTAELHGLINAQAVQIARLDERAKVAK